MTEQDIRAWVKRNERSSPVGTNGPSADVVLVATWLLMVEELKTIRKFLMAPITINDEPLFRPADPNS